MSDKSLFKLSEREEQIIVLIKKGYSNKEIAGELGIAVSTVKTHIKHIMQKKGCRNRISIIINDGKS